MTGHEEEISMDRAQSPGANPYAPVAGDLPSHGFVITKPVRGSDIPADYTFVLTRDEIYVPIAVRKPKGTGPFPMITIGRGNGRGGLPHVQAQVERLASMQDLMLGRGYAVTYVSYRNEIPHLYNSVERAHNIADDVSGEGRTLKSSSSLDSDDMIAILNYLKTLPYVKADALGCVGVSHSGEMILKVAAEMSFTCGVAIEGASHEFLCVNTGPEAPRHDGVLQYQDRELVRKNADKSRAMERIKRINIPILHIGRDRDHLQGIFQLAHEWMLEAGKDSTWVSMDHPEHGYPYLYRQADGSFKPDAIQQKAFDVFMAYFDQRLKSA
jgi:dienelactone hydrolase